MIDSNDALGISNVSKIQTTITIKPSQNYGKFTDL